ncbi:hypothetical protein ABPG75_011110 [Micractinium tetrahymenae]
MAEGGAEPPERLAEIILETSPPHVGNNIKARRRGVGTGVSSACAMAPEAVANRAIKAAASKLEHDEMAASPTHTMRKRDEGGLASAVQEAAQSTARPDLNPVVAAVHERCRPPLSMELLQMAQRQPLPLLPLPLLPNAGAPAVPPAVGAAAKAGPLKSSSLHRLEDLQAYLRQCDDQNYLKHYIKVLSSMPRDLLEELKLKLKARSAWLSGEEQREYKRAKLLNVMGTPCMAPSPARGAGGSVTAADADAFCSQVLAGSGSGSTPVRGVAAARAVPAGAGGGPLERLEMHLDLQQSFATPVEAPKTRPRAAAAEQAAAAAVAAAAAAAAAQAGGGQHAGSADEASPPVAAGVTDHQIAEISPDGQQPAAGGAAEPACKASAAGLRARQATLPGK